MVKNNTKKYEPIFRLNITIATNYILYFAKESKTGLTRFICIERTN